MYWTALWDTIRNRKSDDITLSAAALAFFSILSFAPLLVLILAVTSLVLHNPISTSQFIHTFERSIGVSGLDIVTISRVGVYDPQKSILAIVISSVLALAGSLNVVIQLRHIVDRLFMVPQLPLPGWWRGKVRTYAVSLLFVIILTASITIFFVTGLIITTISSLVEPILPLSHIIWFSLDLILSAAAFFVFFTLSVEYLPHNPPAWRPVITSALFTSILFIAGKWIINLYLRQASVMTAFGAAGSVIALLLWIYYSTHIFLFGVEFAKSLNQLPLQKEKNAG